MDLLIVVSTLVQMSLRDLNLNPRSAHIMNSTRKMSPKGYVCFFLRFLTSYCLIGISPIGNSGGFPRGWEVTEVKKPTPEKASYDRAALPNL